MPPNKAMQTDGRFAAAADRQNVRRLMLRSAMGTPEPAGSKIVQLAQDAVSTGKVQMIRFSDAWSLVLAIEQILTKSKGLTDKVAFGASIDGLRMSCIACGEFSEEAKQAVLMGGKGGVVDQAKAVSFAGPQVSALCQGRCPGCQGDIAMVVFRMPAMPSELPRAKKPWWKLW